MAPNLYLGSCSVFTDQLQPIALREVSLHWSVTTRSIEGGQFALVSYNQEHCGRSVCTGQLQPIALREVSLHWSVTSSSIEGGQFALVSYNQEH